MLPVLIVILLLVATYFLFRPSQNVAPVSGCLRDCKTAREQCLAMSGNSTDYCESAHNTCLIACDQGVFDGLRKDKLARQIVRQLQPDGCKDTCSLNYRTCLLNAEFADDVTAAEQECQRLRDECTRNCE